MFLRKKHFLDRFLHFNLRISKKSSNFAPYFSRTTWVSDYLGTTSGSVLLVPCGVQDILKLAS